MNSTLPVTVQFELALLWRTLQVVRNSSNEIIIDFFEELLQHLVRLPVLSLSDHWKSGTANDSHEEREPSSKPSKEEVKINVISVVGYDPSKNVQCAPIGSVFGCTDLQYLKRLSPHDLKHDPLGVVGRLFDTAAQYVSSMSTVSQKRVLLSVCYTIAMKSGRAKFLLRVVRMLQTYPTIVIDHDCLDISRISAQFLLAAKGGCDFTTIHGRLYSDAYHTPLFRDGKQEYQTTTGLVLGSPTSSARTTAVSATTGILLSFGKADHGKLGHGEIHLHRLVPTVLESLRGVDVYKMSSMSTFSLAISTSGAVYVWGTGGSAGSAAGVHGSIAGFMTDFQPQLLEALPPKIRVVDLSCGLGHALFLLDSGRVCAWGNGGNGRLGQGDSADRTEACAVFLTIDDEESASVATTTTATAGGQKVSNTSGKGKSRVDEPCVSVQCGASHSMVLTASGKVYAWGKNTQGQCGQGHTEDVLRPRLVKKLEPAAIASAIISSSASAGQGSVPSPTLDPPTTVGCEIRQLAAGWEHSIARTANGQLFSWGCGYKDSRRGVIPPVLGLGHNECRTTPELIAAPALLGVRIQHVTCGWDHCLAIAEEGRVYSWGSGQNGKLGHGNEDNVASPCFIAALSSTKIVSVSAGCEHSAAVDENGIAYSWGHGDGGRLGHGNGAQSFEPTKIEALAMMGLRPTMLHCGDKFTMVLAKQPRHFAQVGDSLVWNSNEEEVAAVYVPASVSKRSVAFGEAPESEGKDVEGTSDFHPLLKASSLGQLSSLKNDNILKLLFKNSSLDLDRRPDSVTSSCDVAKHTLLLMALASLNSAKGNVGNSPMVLSSSLASIETIDVETASKYGAVFDSPFLVDTTGSVLDALDFLITSSWLRFKREIERNTTTAKKDISTTASNPKNDPSSEAKLLTEFECLYCLALIVGHNLEAWALQQEINRKLKSKYCKEQGQEHEQEPQPRKDSLHEIVGRFGIYAKSGDRNVTGESKTGIGIESSAAAADDDDGDGETGTRNRSGISSGGSDSDGTRSYSHSSLNSYDRARYGRRGHFSPSSNSRSEYSSTSVSSSSNSCSSSSSSSAYDGREYRKKRRSISSSGSDDSQAEAYCDYMELERRHGNLLEDPTTRISPSGFYLPLTRENGKVPFRCDGGDYDRNSSSSEQEDDHHGDDYGAGNKSTNRRGHGHHRVGRRKAKKSSQEEEEPNSSSNYHQADTGNISGAGDEYFDSCSSAAEYPHQQQQPLYSSASEDDRDLDSFYARRSRASSMASLDQHHHNEDAAVSIAATADDGDGDGLEDSNNNFVDDDLLLQSMGALSFTANIVDMGPSVSLSQQPSSSDASQLHHESNREGASSALLASSVVASQDKDNYSSAGATQNEFQREMQEAILHSLTERTSTATATGGNDYMETGKGRAAAATSTVASVESEARGARAGQHSGSSPAVQREQNIRTGKHKERSRRRRRVHNSSYTRRRYRDDCSANEDYGPPRSQSQHQSQSGLSPQSRESTRACSSIIRIATLLDTISSYCWAVVAAGQSRQGGASMGESLLFMLWEVVQATMVRSYHAIHYIAYDEFISSSSPAGCTSFGSVVVEPDLSQHLLPGVVNGLLRSVAIQDTIIQNKLSSHLVEDVPHYYRTASSFGCWQQVCDQVLTLPHTHTSTGLLAHDVKGSSSSVTNGVQTLHLSSMLTHLHNKFIDCSALLTKDHNSLPLLHMMMREKSLDALSTACINLVTGTLRGVIQLFDENKAEEKVQSERTSALENFILSTRTAEHPWGPQLASVLSDATLCMTVELNHILQRLQQQQHLIPSDASAYLQSLLVGSFTMKGVVALFPTPPSLALGMPDSSFSGIRGDSHHSESSLAHAIAVFPSAIKLLSLFINHAFNINIPEDGGVIGGGGGGGASVQRIWHEWVWKMIHHVLRWLAWSVFQFQSCSAKQRCYLDQPMRRSAWYSALVSQLAHIQIAMSPSNIRESLASSSSSLALDPRHLSVSPTAIRPIRCNVCKVLLSSCYDPSFICLHAQHESSYCQQPLSINGSRLSRDVVHFVLETFCKYLSPGSSSSSKEIISPVAADAVKALGVFANSLVALQVTTVSLASDSIALKHTEDVETITSFVSRLIHSITVNLGAADMLDEQQENGKAKGSSSTHKAISDLLFLKNFLKAKGSNESDEESPAIVAIRRVERALIAVSNSNSNGSNNFTTSNTTTSSRNIVNPWSNLSSPQTLSFIGLLSLLNTSLEDFVSANMNHPSTSSGVGRQENGGDGIGQAVTSLVNIVKVVSSLLPTVCNLNLWVSHNYQRHLLFSRTTKARGLLIGTKDIDHSTPDVCPGVFTPQGDFTLGFWLFLPDTVGLLVAECCSSSSSSDSRASSEENIEYIHLISRMTETGDFNVVDLLSKDPMSTPPAVTPYSFNICLAVDKIAGTVCIVAHCIVQDLRGTGGGANGNSAASRAKAFKRITIQSKPLKLASWSNVVVELVQNHTIVSEEATDQDCDSRRDGVLVALYIDGLLVDSIEHIGSHTPLYQNVVIGKIPRTIHKSSAFDIFEASSASERSKSNRLLVSDVFWVPTCLNSPSKSTEGVAVREALKSATNSLGAISCSKNDSEGRSSSRSSSRTVFENVLTSCPPALLLRFREQLSTSNVLILKSVSQAMDVVTCFLLKESGPVDIAPLDHVLLQIPSLCNLAEVVAAVGSPMSQYNGFCTISKCIQMISAVAVLSPSNLEPAIERLRSSLGHCLDLLVSMLCPLENPLNSNSNVGKEPCVAQSLHLWRNRLCFARGRATASSMVVHRNQTQQQGLPQQSTNNCTAQSSCEWAQFTAVYENDTLIGVVSVLAVAMHSKAVSRSVSSILEDYSALRHFTKDQSDLLKSFIVALCAGGWAPWTAVGHEVDVVPRRLFLTSDPRGVDYVPFPSKATVLRSPTVMVGSYSSFGAVSMMRRRDAAVSDSCSTAIATLTGERNPILIANAAVLLDHCPASASWEPETSLLVPDTSRTGPVPSTEIVPTKNSIDFVPFQAMTQIAFAVASETLSVKHAAELASLLRKVVAQTRQGQGQTTTERNDKAQGTCGLGSMNADVLAMMTQMTYLRSLLVQLTTYSSLSGKDQAKQLQEQQVLQDLLIRELPALLSLACTDPVYAVTAAFNSSGSFKGVQLDVLRNLLKEGDVAFLEKIALRLWKQFQVADDTLSLPADFPFDVMRFGRDDGPGPRVLTYAEATSLIALAPLAGDLNIQDTKIRALSHFPSVRLLNVELERMTGRWYYEATLLSDGLIQIGWANALFRCDPVCGQGVGDHTHSWAFDGLRTKKWNVACEPYGRRWHVGDTVGALLDMDLLEMRFYLNGEDLGAAFEDFGSYDIFPALSLNVRQCVRLNFGQYKFLYPPNEVDGIAFRPVLDALISKPTPAPIPPLPDVILSPVKSVLTTYGTSAGISVPLSPQRSSVSSNVRFSGGTISGERSNEALVSVSAASSSSAMLPNGGLDAGDSTASGGGSVSRPSSRQVIEPGSRPRSGRPLSSSRPMSATQRIAAASANRRAMDAVAAAAEAAAASVTAVVNQFQTTDNPNGNNNNNEDSKNDDTVEVAPAAAGAARGASADGSDDDFNEELLSLQQQLKEAREVVSQGMEMSGGDGQTVVVAAASSSSSSSSSSSQLLHETATQEIAAIVDGIIQQRERQNRLQQARNGHEGTVYASSVEEELAAAVGATSEESETELYSGSQFNRLLRHRSNEDDDNEEEDEEDEEEDDEEVEEDEEEDEEDEEENDSAGEDEDELDMRAREHLRITTDNAGDPGRSGTGRGGASDYNRSRHSIASTGADDEDDAHTDAQNGHLLAMRRQAMIESLIGMGFPFDWALRAAEHFQVATSESAAISWIIERMELEQSKIDDLDEGDSSRVQDEEELEDGDDGSCDGSLEYFMQRHAAAFALSAGGGGQGHGQHSSASSASMAANINIGGGTISSSAANASSSATGSGAVSSSSSSSSSSAVGADNHSGSGTNMTSANNSPSREEMYGIRRALGIVNAGTSMGASSGVVAVAAAASGASTSTGSRNPGYLVLEDTSDATENGQGTTGTLSGAAGGGAGGSVGGSAAIAASISAEAARKSTRHARNANGDAESGVTADMGSFERSSTTWTADVAQQYRLILPGHYAARHRHDLDKQEVLTQVSELDLSDILPIICSCEFALCIYYARFALARVLQRVSATIANSVASSIVECASQRAPQKPHPTPPTQSGGDLLSLSLKVLHCTAGNTISAEMKEFSRRECVDTTDVPHRGIAHLFKILFKQAVVSVLQPDRLYPLLSHANTAGDLRDRSICLSGGSFCSENTIRLHHLLSEYERCLFATSSATLCTEESAVQSPTILSNYLRVLLRLALSPVEEAVVDSSSSSSRSGPNRSHPSEFRSSSSGNDSSRISSGLQELQGAMLRGVGVHIAGMEESPAVTTTATYYGKSALHQIGEEALINLERAARSCQMQQQQQQHQDSEATTPTTTSGGVSSGSKLHTQLDWISLGLERDDTIGEVLLDKSDFSTTATAAAAASSTAPFVPAVLWAHWTLLQMLRSHPIDTDPRTSCDLSPNKFNRKLNEENDSKRMMTHFESIVSVKTLARLVRAAFVPVCPNASLKFILLDLCAVLLSRLNQHFSSHIEEESLSGHKRLMACAGAVLGLSVHCTEDEEEPAHHSDSYARSIIPALQGLIRNLDCKLKDELCGSGRHARHLVSMSGRAAIALISEITTLETLIAHHQVRDATAVPNLDKDSSSSTSTRHVLYCNDLVRAQIRSEFAQPALRRQERDRKVNNEECVDNMTAAKSSSNFSISGFKKGLHPHSHTLPILRVTHISSTSISISWDISEAAIAHERQKHLDSYSTSTAAAGLISSDLKVATSWKLVCESPVLINNIDREDRRKDSRTSWDLIVRASLKIGSIGCSSSSSNSNDLPPLTGSVRVDDLEANTLYRVSLIASSSISHTTGPMLRQSSSSNSNSKDSNGNSNSEKQVDSGSVLHSEETHNDNAAGKKEGAEEKDEKDEKEEHADRTTSMEPFIDAALAAAIDAACRKEEDSDDEKDEKKDDDDDDGKGDVAVYTNAVDNNASIDSNSDTSSIDEEMRRFNSHLAMLRETDDAAAAIAVVEAAEAAAAIAICTAAEAAGDNENLNINSDTTTYFSRRTEERVVISASSLPVATAHEADDGGATTSSSSRPPLFGSDEDTQGTQSGATRSVQESACAVEFVSTESEALFKFETKHVSPNIQLCPPPAAAHVSAATGTAGVSASPSSVSTRTVQFLTIRNVANKRWSTARASVRMMSGVHSWDVRIERCISKNIFLGVATKDARLDNYVGCDRFGWAFLANRALWHNKGKVRGYGELFRSGDTVSVLLDLDRGTLSFSLNGRSLGVAVEGLAGPLYPAFSLYNEDDSITVQHIRSSGEGGAGLDHGTGAADTEKLLCRIETMRNMMNYIACGHRAVAVGTSGEECGLSASSVEDIKDHAKFVKEAGRYVTADLTEELHARWLLWSQDVPIHAVLHRERSHSLPSLKGGISATPALAADCAQFVVIRSSRQCVESMSQNRLSLWDTVIFEGRTATIVGVGAHRLWLAGHTSTTNHSSIAEVEVKPITLEEQQLQQVFYSTTEIVERCVDGLGATGLGSTNELLSLSGDSLRRAIAVDSIVVILPGAKLNLSFDMSQSFDETFYNILLIPDKGTEKRRGATTISEPELLAVVSQEFLRTDLQKKEMIMWSLAEDELLVACLAMLAKMPRISDEQQKAKTANMNSSSLLNHFVQYVSKIKALHEKDINAHEEEANTSPAKQTLAGGALGNNGSSSSIGVRHVWDFLEPNTMAAKLCLLIFTRTLKELTLRCLLLLHMNWLLLPLLPVLCPYTAVAAATHHSEQEQEGNGVGVAHELKSLRSLLFPSVFAQFMCQISSASATLDANQKPPGMGTATAGTGAGTGADTADGHNESSLSASSCSCGLYLHIRPEKFIAEKIMAASGVSHTHVGSPVCAHSIQHPTLADEWQLLTGIQSSYVGQMWTFMEQVASSNSASAMYFLSKPLKAGGVPLTIQQKNHHHHHQLQGGGHNGALWEFMFRSNNRCSSPPLFFHVVRSTSGRSYTKSNTIVEQRGGNSVDETSSSSSVVMCKPWLSEVILPFRIRKAVTKTDTPTAAVAAVAADTLPTDDDATRLNSLIKICSEAITISGGDTIEYQERLIFSTFVEDAMEQISLFIQSIFKPTEQQQSSSSIWPLTAAKLNLLLQLFHASGALVGLAIRAGLCFKLALPSQMYDVLSSSHSSSVERISITAAVSSMPSFEVHSSALLMEISALVLRNGILSLLPEPAFDLIHPNNMRAIFEGGFGGGCASPLQLRTRAHLSDGLSPLDAHIQRFWVAVYSLSVEQLRKFCSLFVTQHPNAPLHQAELKVATDLNLYSFSSIVDEDPYSMESVHSSHYLFEIVSMAEEFLTEGCHDSSELIIHPALALKVNGSSSAEGEPCYAKSEKKARAVLVLPKYSSVDITMNFLLRLLGENNGGI